MTRIDNNLLKNKNIEFKEKKSSMLKKIESFQDDNQISFVGKHKNISKKINDEIINSISLEKIEEPSKNNIIKKSD